MADFKKLGKGVTGALTKAKEMAQAKKAASADQPGVHYADPLQPATMRMSEALGNAGAEGKTLNFTEADRSRVFAKNRGGVGFSGLQQYSEPHKKANTVWGFGNTATAEKKIRQNDPENSLFTTFVGSPQQHKSNSVVIGDAIKNFQDAVKKGAVPREQIMLMNKRLNEITDQKTGAKVFEDGFDLTDPSALNVANTFSRRAAVGDVMLGLGVKGPMARLDFKKQYPNTKFTDASKIEDILKRETDPDLVDAGTYDVGNRLFVMDGKIIERPDLNEAFPVQVTGTDLGMKYQLVPPDKAMRDFYKAREGRKDKNDKPSPVTYYDLARAEPSQFVDEDYLTFLQKEGYKKGGTVSREESPEDMARFQKRFAMHKAIGGKVKKMAGGGKVSIFDAPVKRMAKGGGSNYHPDVQEALKAGRITPNQAKWMNNYQNTPGNPEIGTAGIRDGISEKMMNYRNAVRAGEYTRPHFMEPIPKEVKMPYWSTGKLDLDREGLRQLDKIPGLTKKAFRASEYSNTFPAGTNDVNYYNELLKASKEAPDYQPYVEEMNKLKERNSDIGKASGGRASIFDKPVHMVDGGKIGRGVMGAVNKAKQMANDKVAERAIGKAAESAGMKAPVTANKDLTTVQDFHTSFGDSVRKRAADMQATMDSLNYKYDKGQRVFTEDSARKNWPPMTVLGRVLEGNRIMREDPTDFLSKKIVDEATGKAKRTPHEPGYKVRLEHSPDNWSEFVIPESAIKGNVDMARGGFMRKADGGKIAKGVVGALTKAQEIAKARKAADMAPTARINLPAPGILIPSKLNNVRELVRQSKGNYGARRVERAADEIPNLERLYKEQALKEAFTGDNARALMTMNPKDFENFAMPLDPRFMDANSTRYTTSGERLPYPEYMSEYLPNVGAFSEVPFLMINKQEQGLPLTPFISGHEGRHRNRVMADKGEEAGLVLLNPRSELREPFPRRSQEDYIEALKEELAMTGNKVVPESHFDNFKQDVVRRKPIILPDIYAKGGLAMAEGGNVLKGNILAGASWNSLNKTLGNELTTLTGQPTINTSVGGATTADTYKQLMDFINGGGSFDPNATVFLQTGGVDFITGVPREEVKNNIEQIISVLEDQGVNVVLTGAPYAASMDDVINNNFDPRIDPLFEEIAAAHSNVALVDSMGDILQDKTLLSDAIHTNETGTRRYNDDVMGALTTLQQRESQGQEGREAATNIPQQVERITQPELDQSPPTLSDNIPAEIVTDEALNDSDVIPTDKAENDSDVAEAIAKLDNEEQEVAVTEAYDNMDDYQPPQQVSSVPDYSRAYEALGGADVVNGLRDQLLGMGIDESIIADAFSKYYPNEYQPEFAQEQYKRGGAVGQESPEDMARFQKRFAMHKAIGGGVKKMAGGGRASIFDAPAKRMSKGGSSDEPTAKEIAEALGELTVNQGREEYESFKKPRAATDIGNRGILAPALGAPVDLMNMGLMAADYIGSKATGKPIRLSSEKPFGGSEHLKDLMDKYGVTSGEDRPLTETMLSLFSPTGMIKGAQGMTKGAVKAAGAMRKPMSGLGAVREKTN